MELFYRLDVPYPPVAYNWAHRLGFPVGPPGRRARSNVGRALVLNYPFRSTDRPTLGSDVLEAVLRVMPRGLPPEIRADVSQDVLLAIYEGEVARSDIGSVVPAYVRDYYRRFGHYNEVSLSMPMRDDNSRTLGDALSGERSFEYWERR
jgi:hypothetical protein